MMHCSAVLFYSALIIAVHSASVTVSWTGLSEGKAKVSSGAALSEIKELERYWSSPLFVVGDKKSHQILKWSSTIEEDLSLIVMDQHCVEILFEQNLADGSEPTIFQSLVARCNMSMFYDIHQAATERICVPDSDDAQSLSTCISECSRKPQDSSSHFIPPASSSSSGSHGPEPLRVVSVSDVENLFKAMREALPGDCIKLAFGTYDYTTYAGAQKIDTQANGTASAPITLTAADPNNRPVITGSSHEIGYVLHIQGDYWVIENLVITTSQKGIVFDHSSHSIIRNCEVKDTGSEAIALRDGSSHCLVTGCYIHDIGVVTPRYGEGVYIGSATGTGGFNVSCHYNTVRRCTFSKVGAEHVDVKEYTTGTVIEGCTFDGTGMSGENYAGSFVDIAGDECVVQNNVGYRNNNPKIVAAFEIHQQVAGSIKTASFFGNTVYLDREKGEDGSNRPMYVVDGWDIDIKVKNNKADHGHGLVDVADSYYHVNSITKV